MDIKQQAWELRQQGYSYSEIAKKLGIGKSTVYKYIKQYEKKSLREPAFNESGAADDTTNNEYDVERNLIPDELKDYIEDGETKLQVVTADKVIDEINKRITVVKEPEVKVKKIDENVEEQPISKVKNFVGNKFLLFVIIIAVIGIGVAVYYIFFRRKPEPKVEEQIEEAKEKIIKKRSNPQAESTYDHVSRYGIKDKVVVL